MSNDKDTNVIKFKPRKKKAAQNRFNLNSEILNQPISENEVKSISTLIAWIANKQNVSLDLVRSLFENEFGLKDFGTLRLMDYENAIKFLVDMRINRMVH